MLIERQISVAFAGISAALVLPAYGQLINVPPAHAATSPLAVFIGTMLGALAVLMGALLGVDELEGSKGAFRVWALMKTTLWSCIALLVSGGTGMVALRAPSGGWRVALLVSALTPVAALGLAISRWKKG